MISSPLFVYLFFSEKERKEIDEITKLILSQEQNLKTQNNKIQTACCDIQKSEFQVQKWNVGLEKSSNYKVNYKIDFGNDYRY